MTFVDRPLPESLVLPTLREKRIANLTHEGRKPGSTSKITKDLKEGIIDAAVIVGSDGNGKDGLTGFLVDLALHHKKAFTSLLVKVLPMQISGNTTLGAHIGAINIVSVPAGNYLSEADIERFRQPGHSNDGSSVSELQPAPVLELEQPRVKSAPIDREFEPQTNPQLSALEAKLLAMDHDQLLQLAEALNVGK